MLSNEVHVGADWSPNGLFVGPCQLIGCWTDEKELVLEKQSEFDFSKVKEKEQERWTLAEMRWANSRGRGLPGSRSVADCTTELQASKPIWDPFGDTNFALVVYDITGTPLVELQLHNSQLTLVYFTFNHLWAHWLPTQGSCVVMLLQISLLHNRVHQKSFTKCHDIPCLGTCRYWSYLRLSWSYLGWLTFSMNLLIWGG